MSRLDHCYNIADLRKFARRRLPKGVFEYVDRGAEDEVALASNREAFKRLKLRTRFLVDLSERDMGIDLLGKRAECAAIAASQRFAHRAVERRQVQLRLEDGIAAGRAGEDHVRAVAEGDLPVLQQQHNRHGRARLADGRETGRHRLAFVGEPVGLSPSGADRGEILVEIARAAG